MGYSLNVNAFNSYLEELSKTYKLFSPVRISNKGRLSETDVVGYGEIEKYKDMVLDEKSYFSPKEILFPIRETLFYFLENSVQEADIDTKPIIIFLRPCDLNGIRRLDTIFLKNGEEVDYYYLRRRNLVKFIMIECTKGFDTCFCVSMESNIATDYDAAIRFGEEIQIEIKDTALDTNTLKNNTKIEFKPDFIQSNKVQVNIPPVEKVTKETFNNEIWKEYTSRCIACGRCNTSCITCSCYTMQDTVLSDDEKMGERRRVWSGCHIDGFSDMAGGHSFRDKNGERMRFKTMHKINDFYKRFDEHMCVGCGRCDDVCPEYISFSKCINKLNDIVREDEEV